MLSDFFAPKSVAIIGASRKPSKIGSIILSNLRKGGYTGVIYPINPNCKTLQGFDCYPSVLNIPNSIDVAVISVPSTIVPFVVSECVDKEIKYIVVITAGFSETGEAGKKLEEDIKERLKNTKTRLLGVNCLGYINPSQNLNISFAGKDLKNGKIAFLSQSGAFGTSALDFFKTTSVGIKYFISLGNKTDLNENDFLNEWIDDKEISIIALYLESLADGINFRKITEKISKKIPIILLKPGKSENAKKAISSHTGSIVEDSMVASTAFKQSGILEVNTIRQFFDTIQFLALNKIPYNKEVVVVTNAGGPGIQTVDQITKRKLSLHILNENTREKLEKILPSSSSVKNPIDILGDATPQRYFDTLEAIESDPDNFSVITILTPQAMTKPQETAAKISKIINNSTKLHGVSFIGGEKLDGSIKLLKQNKIFCTEYPEDFINVLSAISKYSKWVDTKNKSKYLFPKIKFIKPVKVFSQIVKELHRKNIKVVPAEYLNHLFLSAGITIPKSNFVTNLSESVYTANQIGYPIVMKISSQKVLHKVDIKGVYLNLKNDDEVIQAFNKLSKIKDEFEIENKNFIQMQEHITDGIEIIIGVKRNGELSEDNQKINGLGHMMIFGQGGTYAELCKDFSKKMIPLTDIDVAEIIRNTNVYKILSGYRTSKKYNISDILNTIMFLNYLVSQIPLISEVDINPIIATSDHAYCADIKMIIG